MLEEGCKVARILDLAPPEAFEDHRNAEPYRLDWQTAEVREPTISRPTANWFLPCVSSSRWILETPRVSGYTPDDYLDRAYMLEIWIEKSTMDDVLVPLTRELGVRLVTSVGFQSHSNVIKLLQRVREIGKPTRIFYISDYDKAGRGMPIAVARHIEFYRPKYAPDSDIKLSILALTPEQIDQFDLPRSVEKAGATELDALEALRPGELERIVRSAIEPYLAKSINAQLDAAQRQAQTIVRQKWSRLMTPHQQTLEILRTRVETIRKKHEKRLQRELAPFEKPLARLKADVERAALSFRPKLPARPTQAANDPTSQDCLFDSSRPYLVQLRFYKSQRKSAE